MRDKVMTGDEIIMSSYSSGVLNKMIYNFKMFTKQIEQFQNHIQPFPIDHIVCTYKTIKHQIDIHLEKYVLTIQINFMNNIKKETVIYDCLAKQIELYGDDKSQFNLKSTYNFYVNMTIHHERKYMSKCCYRTVLCKMVEDNYIQKKEIYENKYIYWTTEKIMNNGTNNIFNDAIRRTEKQISTTKFTTKSTEALNIKKILIMDEVIQTILVSECQMNTTYVQDEIMDTIH